MLQDSRTEPRCSRKDSGVQGYPFMQDGGSNLCCITLDHSLGIQ